MRLRHVAIGVLAGVAGLGFIAVAATRAEDPPRPDQLVDALNGVFGKHPGDRAAHTKGICLTGQFTPSPDAPSLSKAPQFAKPVPIIARFSLGGGNPQAADNQQDNVRGLAVRFDNGNGAISDLVMISAPVFFVQTPALFVELLQTVASKDQDKIKDAARQLKELMDQMPRPKDTAQKVRDVLTPEQQTAFDAKVKEMREKLQSEGKGKMQAHRAARKNASKSSDTAKPDNNSKTDTTTQDGKLDL